MSDGELSAEVERRQAIHRKWRDLYWDEMIPLAHGVRLFGELYTAAVKPDDPYEFARLLEGGSFKGLERNERLLALAARVGGKDDLDAAARQELAELLADYGGTFEATTDDSSGWASLLARMAGRAALTREEKREQISALERRYLDRFEGRERERAERILKLARASYRLRDDDNIYLGRIEAQLRAAEAELTRRGLAVPGRKATDDGDEELARSAARLPESSSAATGTADLRVRARQLVGQPAGPGVARGRAHVIESRRDLFDFSADEVLVCDAVDPNMTFVIPLAGAVVERRGGMLIHGAIIAREYGLPCVTGIPEATVQITTGDDITVDGFLGLVTVHDESRQPD
jgi:pyruvate,water dikinase